MAIKLPGFLNPPSQTGMVNNLLPGLQKKLKGGHWMLIAVLGLAAVAIILIPQSASQQPQSETSLPGSDTINTASLALSVLFKLAFVILLIYVSVYLLKRWQAVKISGSSKKLSILETTHLSQRQALHLVQVGGQVFLIGATDQAISYLLQVENSKPGEGDQTPVTETVVGLKELESLNEASSPQEKQALPVQPQALPSFTSILANAFGKR